MAFHQVRFPLDIALGAQGGPERATDVVTLASGREERNLRWAHARRRYNAGYGIKSRADMLTVLAFFQERRGRFHSFLWRDAVDFSSSPEGGTTMASDQRIGTGDGETRSFQLVKHYGASFDPYLRPITKPEPASVRVAIDGAELSVGAFAVEPLTGSVTLESAPEAGAIVTAGFCFDVPVRFDTDRLDVEMAGFDAALAPSIPLIEVIGE
ncbi:TIGR02217 family protein [Pelagibacterium sp.]|uniref:phage distal tail protein, Rcc01695 family n=1 Tax=Pelagibacterium sp. TaxID=1967288 RepID=UPI003A92AF62